MNEQMKAQMYGDLLNQHTKLHNQINEIKGQSIELNQQQLIKIRQLEQQQLQIMSKINQLFS